MVEDAQFEHIAEVGDSGRPEDAIREAQALLGHASNDEKAALLGGMHVNFCKLGRLGDAWETLEQLKQLQASDISFQLITTFYEATLLIQERKYEAGASAFAAALERHRDAFQEARFRYLYEDIQCRRAEALVFLSRCNEALPILREALSFTFDQPGDEQRVHYYLGECLMAAGEAEEGRKELDHAVSFGLQNAFEERALWRLAAFHFETGALAQAQLKLEMILRDFPGPATAVPREKVFRLLSKTFHFLGDKTNEEHYASLAKRA